MGAAVAGEVRVVVPAGALAYGWGTWRAAGESRGEGGVPHGRPGPGRRSARVHTRRGREAVFRSGAEEERRGKSAGGGGEAQGGAADRSGRRRAGSVARALPAGNPAIPDGTAGGVFAQSIRAGGPGGGVLCALADHHAGGGARGAARSGRDLRRTAATCGRAAAAFVAAYVAAGARAALLRVPGADRGARRAVAEVLTWPRKRSHSSTSAGFGIPRVSRSGLTWVI